jgi:hypothetical protein
LIGMIGEGKQPEGNTQAMPVHVSRAGVAAKTLDTLDRCEKRVLEVLTDPLLYKATAVERIKAAGVSKNRYYAILRDPAFMALQREMVNAVMRERIAPVIGAMLDTASVPGRDGHGDRELACEMAGFYTPKQYHDHSVKSEIVGVIGLAFEKV